jgi:hypothetical protein
VYGAPACEEIAVNACPLVRSCDAALAVGTVAPQHSPARAWPLGFALACGVVVFVLVMYALTAALLALAGYAVRIG